MKLLDMTSARTGLALTVRHARLALLAGGVYALAYALEAVTAARLSAAEGPLWHWLLAMLAGFVAVIPAAAAFVRLGLGQGARLSLGQDERRLLGVMALIWVLLFTVLGTAGLALMFMITALAVINVDVTAQPPAGPVDIFALFGTGEWIVAIVIMAAFAGFSLWFAARLAFSLPSTVDSARIRVLSIWPASSGRWVEIGLTLLAAAAPGLVILIAWNAAAASLTGIWPGLPYQGAEGEAAPLALIAGLGALHGLLKIALAAAPACAALGALYVKYQSDSPLEA
ncbi:hypothetical protein F1654_01560 [Alkalicaulis satelles]|uniref:Glycerophosphoryl diester phosphodiesterase membrane domain-containing protein n=1 Tax=Alkalicaulis satelles TaxID=2609175 RepID=A0A5M6ZIR2_9PROT|nr:hypothetical protein [Alkalicaulis satelles]KAA5804716.1 hypothetical protein F1654_01560 [Alkalicaulis satelles]